MPSALDAERRSSERDNSTLRTSNAGNLGPGASPAGLAAKMDASMASNPLIAASSTSPSRAAKTATKVRFPAQPITAIWAAESSSDYDRRSIVVDLSKTPFALLRKDSVLMKQSTANPLAAPLPRPAPPAIKSVRPTDTPCSFECRRSLSFTPATGLWDSDGSSDSSGHTDTETDFDMSEASDAEQPMKLFPETNTIDSSPDCKADAAGTAVTGDPCLEEQFERLGSGTGEGGPAFYGVWKRTSCEGYEELLRSSGVPKRAAAMALQKHPLHIIDHDGAYFRLIVKNGLSKVDETFFIGEPRVDKIRKETYDVSLNWANFSGTGTNRELTLSSVCREKGEEVIAIRSLEDGGSRMVLTQIVRRPAEQYEVKAKHFFKRVLDKSELRTNCRGPSSNVVTVRQPKKHC